MTRTHDKRERDGYKELMLQRAWNAFLRIEQRVEPTLIFVLALLALVGIAIVIAGGL